MDSESIKMISAASCMAVGALAAAIGEGWIGRSAMEALGRNPSVGGKLLSTMLVAMAIVESLAIYCLIISLIILFVL